ncbi:MAG TPA: hypothetical protein VFH85_04720 [Gammaproteobacteria bacterium]|nr:hypothetical protein [Gammaproteobacteria bacterium]
MLKRIFILLSMLAIASPALADVELQYIDSDSGKPAAEVVVRDGRVRFANPAQSQSILYESAQHRFLVLDNAAKTYRVIDRQSVADLRREIARVKSAAQMLPDSIRKMIQGRAPKIDRLLNHPLPTVTVGLTGPAVHVGSWTCRTLTIAVNGGIGYGACVAPAQTLGVPEKDARTLAEMVDDLRALADGNLVLKPEAQAFLLKRLRVPVKYANFARNRMQLLNKVRHDEVLPEQTAVPSDYEQRPLVDVGAYQD